MNAAELRRRLSDEELESLARADRGSGAAFLPILERLADVERLFDLTCDQRKKVADRAARLLRTPRPPSPSARAAMLKGTWRERGFASARSLNGYALRPVGSLRGGDSKEDAQPIRYLDGLAASRALATALREVGSPDVVEAQARLAGDAASALRHEADGAIVWEEALSPLLGEFAWNAQGAGASRQEGALQALAAAAALTGRARQGDADVLPSLLGSAARTILREERPAAHETRAAHRLAMDLAERTSVRQAIWGDLGAEELRLLGAAVACAVFGKGPLRPYDRPRIRMPFDPRSLPEAWHERFAHLTAAAAAEELARLSSDPRLGHDDRAMAAFAADAAVAHPAASRISFAEALGLEAQPLRFDRLRHERLLRAAPRGRHPAKVLCQGKHGRLIRCRAVADARGAMVGWLAFDPLSREIGGRPVFAAYGLDGARQGYAWADEPVFWRAGRPGQGFISAPETIPV